MKRESEDLFAQIEKLPIEVQNIINGFDENKDRYAECKRLLIELKPLGYKFEYGLDGSPYDLKKIDSGKIKTKRLRI